MKNFLLAKLIGQTERSIINWRGEGRPIIRLVEAAFTEKDIMDFLEKGYITISATSDNAQRLYPVIKRSLKMRVLDFSNDQMMTRAFQRYINNLAKRIAPILSAKRNEDISDALKLIFQTMEEIRFREVIKDPAVTYIASEFILGRMQDFFIDMTEDERNFIVQNPYEFSEITYSTFSFVDKYIIGGVEKPALIPGLESTI